MVGVIHIYFFESPENLSPLGVNQWVVGRLVDYPLLPFKNLQSYQRLRDPSNELAANCGQSISHLHLRLEPKVNVLQPEDALIAHLECQGPQLHVASLHKTVFVSQ